MKQEKNSRAVGMAFEEKAILYLKEKGYEILDRNFTCRQGELDIVARDQDILAFVEVKYRKNARAGEPEEGVTGRKRARLLKAARYYLYCKEYPVETPCRFDVVAICGEELRHYRDAFDAEGRLW